MIVLFEAGLATDKRRKMNLPCPFVFDSSGAMKKKGLKALEP
jgi:hypothetical protein